MRYLRTLGFSAAALVALTLACEEATSPGFGLGVAVNDNFFSPSNLGPVNLPTGGQDSVTWVWGGVNAHNVTFEDGQGNTTMDLTTGQHVRTFNATGTYRYRCTNHSTDFTAGMVGRVIFVQ